MFDIDSIPPTRTTECSPAAMALAPSMTARIPEPQTLWSVTAPVDFGSPAQMAAWRAGAWPMPACKTLPRITWSTLWPGTSARSRQDFKVRAPSSGAARDERDPRKLPTGVRAAESTRTFFIAIALLRAPGRHGPGRAGF